MRLRYSLTLLFILGIILTYSCNLIIVKTTEDRIYSTLDSIPKKPFALVLGCNKKGPNGVNLYFRYRMEAAAELYHAGKIEYVLVSGDNHIVTYDEPTDMKDYLISLGVPENRIICDYAGFRTLDSVMRAQKVFHCHELIIVSQKFHNERALFIADWIGMDAIAYNARDVGRSTNYTHMREYVARVAVFMDLFVLGTQPKFPQ